MGQVVHNLLFGIYITDTYSQIWECGKQNFAENLKCAIKNQTKRRKAVEEK